MNSLKRSTLALVLLAGLGLSLAPPALAGAPQVLTNGVGKVGGLVFKKVLLTPTGAEINTLADEVASAAAVTVPATGACGVQFTFKNGALAAVTGVRSILAYLSDVNGGQVAAQTSLVALTNGTTTQLVTGKTILATSTSAGLWGVTLTASAGTYYLTFILPNGKLITSAALVCN